MSAIVRFDSPLANPVIDHPREDRREVGNPERRTWALYASTSSWSSVRDLHHRLGAASSYEVVMHPGPFGFWQHAASCFTPSA